jgi:hypothetical protein
LIPLRLAAQADVRRGGHAGRETLWAEIAGWRRAVSVPTFVHHVQLTTRVLRLVVRGLSVTENFIPTWSMRVITPDIRFCVVCEPVVSSQVRVCLAACITKDD